MQIVMGWPECIIVALLVFRLLEKVNKSKQIKKGAERAGYLFGSLSSISLWLALLYWGGFFS